ncbi:hypothetical protein [Streptomyces sp. M10]|uniref:hypothetical protein n=1 Tax=Streptomyces sp. M10 TaxID=412968 RepID=UPI000646436F|nr:hypothetical protein [Streptomyces sp. M10]
MNAEQWNALHPVGTPVFAFPGFRPEDEQAGWSCERIESQTRSRAWTLGGHTPVVMVEGRVGGIALTHVDPACASGATTLTEASETTGGAK